LVKGYALEYAPLKVYHTESGGEPCSPKLKKWAPSPAI
jgi:hypothetical protein